MPERDEESPPGFSHHARSELPTFHETGVEARIVVEAPASGVDKPADWRVVGVDLVTARSGPVQPGAPGVRPGGF